MRQKPIGDAEKSNGRADDLGMASDRTYVGEGWKAGAGTTKAEATARRTTRRKTELYIVRQGGDGHKALII